MRISRVVAGLVFGLVIATVGVPAHASVTGTTVATPDFTVTFSVGDVVFDGPDCVDVPVSSTYTKTNAQPVYISGRLDLSANQTGASNGIGTSISASYGGTTSQTNDHGSMKVCPDQIDLKRGPLVISGTLRSTSLAGPSYEAPVPLGSISLNPNPTTVRRPKVKLTGSSFTSAVTVTGVATVQTLTKGVVPAGGTLVLQVRKPGSRQWVSGVTTSTDNYGEYEFQLRPPAKYPRGTLYRVAVTDCGWCSDAVSPVGRRR